MIVQEGWNARPLKMGPIGCPETSVRNYQSTLRKIPKKGRYIYTAAEGLNRAIKDHLLTACIYAYKQTTEIN